jgi:phosphotransferase system enzyme I (PtsI)
MEILKGIPVSPGVFIGEAFLLVGVEARIPERHITAEQVAEEAARYEDACTRVVTELTSIRGVTEQQLGANLAAILSVQVQLLQDPSLKQRILNRICQQLYSAEYAVARTLRDLTKLMSASENQMIAHRASDIYDLQKRLLNVLLGAKREDLEHLQRPVALISHDLGPSQTAALDREKVKAFAIDVGGRTSHTAILARALEIPAVVGLETVSGDVTSGENVVIDGNRGIVIVSPDERTLKRYRKLQQEQAAFEAALIKDKDLPAVTQDGMQVHVLANIEFPEEVEGALQHGSQGVGLFRTEFLYLKSGVMPGEDDHYAVYHRSARQLDGRPLVIRSLDLGADKIYPTDSFYEHNPFLGLRSIRLSMKRPENFRLQLRAVLRASSMGKVKLLLPMISCIEELRWAKGIVEEIKSQLTVEKQPFDSQIQVGIMIEVPSAALEAQALAKECDFFSIGTNDLVQYTLAVDRGNEHVAHLYNAAHPAHWKLIRMAIQAAQEARIGVCMCGEMAGDPIFTQPLLGLGLTEFSVSPATIPELKRVIRSVSMEHCKQVAATVLSMEETDAIQDFLRTSLGQILPGGFGSRAL